VGQICSFVNSMDALLNFRLVNHIFQQEATKRLRKVRHPIDLNIKVQVQKFLGLAKNRQKLNLFPFPFSSFQLHLTKSLTRRTLNDFGRTVGPHIERYSIQTVTQYNTSIENVGKLAILLSHSPNLSKLKFESSRELHLFERDFIFIPKSFPHLKSLKMTNPFTSDSISSTTPYPLLDLIVQRAEHLQKITVPGNQLTMSSRIIRYLAQNRPKNNLPYFLLANTIDIYPKNISLVREIMDSNWSFTKIHISMDSTTANQMEALRMLQTLSTWLERQSSSLTDLKLDIRLFCFRHLHHVPTFEVPSLRALTNLEIFYPYSKWPIILPAPVLINPFPVLETLTLRNYSDDYETFSTAIPSVKRLDVISLYAPISDHWRIAFPNLTVLYIEVDANNEEERFIRPTLQSILTHFTGLVDLDLEFTSWSSFNSPSDCDYWDLLTGGAPRSFDDLKLLTERSQGLVRLPEPQVPLNGNTQIPSLRNMRGLYLK